MVPKTFMVEFAASGSETVVSRVVMRIITGCLIILKWNVPSRALTGGVKQCLMFTNQFITLKDRLSA